MNSDMRMTYFPDTKIRTGNCHRHVRCGVDAFLNFIGGLVHGDIPVSNVEMLLKYKDNVMELFCTLERYNLVPQSVLPSSGMKKDKLLGQIMKWRDSELNAFRREIKQMLDATSFLDIIPRGKCKMNNRKTAYLFR